MTVSVKYRQQLTGGTTTSLDEIVSTMLNDGDFSFTVDGNKIYAHKYDSTSTASEDSPNVIIPDDLPTSGRWILQVSPFDVVVPPPSGELLTGNILGGTASMNVGSVTETDIDFTACKCYDSTGTVLLESAAQTVTVPNTDPRLQNYFLCNDGIIRTDTDENGVNLLAGPVTHLRWIFFNRASNTGHRSQFLHYGDRILFLASPDVGSMWVADVSTTWNSFDHSGLLPESRISEIWYGVGGLDTALVQSRDGQVGSDGVTKRITAYHGTGPTSYDWGSNNYRRDGFIVYNALREFSTNANNLGLHINGVRIIR